ncbi:MAG: DUF4149 domain-containing protein [Nitrospiraceae bacterium]
MSVSRTVRLGLLACYVLEVTALAIWIGGLVAIIAAVIPAVFNAFGASMETAGRLLTRVFDGYNRLVIGAMVMLAAASAWRLWVSTRRGRADAAVTRVELGLLVAMILVALLIVLVLGPALVIRQEQAFAAQGEVAKKAAFEVFFRIHQVVRGLYVLNLGLGLVLLGVKIHHCMGRAETQE